MIILRLYIFGQNHTQMAFPSQSVHTRCRHVLEQMMLILIISSTCCLLSFFAAELLFFFSFIINTYLEGDIFETMQIFFISLYFHPLILAPISVSFQEQLLVWYSNNYFYFIHFFYIH